MRLAWGLGMASADKDRNYEHICPLAERRKVGDRVELCAPTLGICAQVERNESSRGWLYSVSCQRYGRNFRGQKDDQATAVSEMLFWLGSFDCPGRLSGCNR